MFRFDRTQRSIVVICVQCAAREICTSQAAADRWSLDHLDRAHPGITSAEHQRITAGHRQRRRRGDTPG